MLAAYVVNFVAQWFVPAIYLWKRKMQAKGFDRIICCLFFDFLPNFAQVAVLRYVAMV